MKTLVIKGFQDQKQIDTFLSWFDGQGEQDFGNWLDVADIGISFIQFKKCDIDGDVTEATAKIYGIED
jgi:hypothetical protein